MEVQNLSGDCLFSPTLIGLTGGKLDFGSIGQGAPYFDPRPFTFTNFRDEITNQYNTAFTPSFKQYINYEISAITQCVSAYTSGATGIVNYWSADTVALPADYIRVSGNSTSAIVGGNLEVSGVVRTNRISNGVAATAVSILPDNSSKKVLFGYSDEQGLGSSYTFLTLQFAYPNLTETLFQLSQGGDLIFKSNASNGHELFRLDQDLNQASAYTLTAANSLGVSGDTEVAGTLSGRTISGRTLTLKENLGVSGRTFLGTLDAAGAGYTEDKILVAQSTGEIEYLTAAEVGGGGGFFTADTTGTNSHYVRLSGNTTGAKFGGNVDITGDTTIASNLTVEHVFNSYSGESALFVGFQAGQGYETGGSGWNTGIGARAMGVQVLEDSSIRNTAVGAYALSSLKDGDHHTALGMSALQDQTGGTDNVAVGWEAQAGSHSLTHNTSVGVGTLRYGGYYNASNRRDNTVVGYNSGYYAFYGRENAAVGSESLVGALVGGNTGPTGSTAVGYRALYSNAQGTYNTSVGWKAGDNITTGGKNICIGADADPPSATADYQMNIGGIIHGQDAYTDSAISQIGIGTTAPLTKLDVHHNPTDLADNTGGGEVVTFGTEHGSDTLAAGKLMYLNSSGVWRYADADVNGKGADELLAIALGTSVSDGLLIRGFFDLVAELSGSFVKGRACYVGTPAAQIQFAQPSGSGDFVRIVGYGTSTANIIYFNPDGTYITVA